MTDLNKCKVVDWCTDFDSYSMFTDRVQIVHCNGGPYYMRKWTAGGAWESWVQTTLEVLVFYRAELYRAMNKDK